MKSILLSALFLFVVTLSLPVRSADEMYQIIALRSGLRDALNANDSWMSCGDYFASAESTEGKIVHFTYEIGSFGNSSKMFAFPQIGQIIVRVNDMATAPMVVLLRRGSGSQFGIIMSAADYVAGLPCLANGPSI